MSKVATTSTITFSDEQSMLLDTAVSFFRDKSPVSKVRELLSSQDGFETGLWQEIAELGWLGLAIPEGNGGSGLSLAEAVTIAEPMGRYLCHSPFHSTQLAIQAVLAGGSDAQKQRWLPQFATGMVGTVALFEDDGDWHLSAPAVTAERTGNGIKLSGTKCFVVDGAVADVIVVSADLGGTPCLALVAKADLGGDALAAEQVVDQTRRSYRLQLQGVTVPEENLIEGAAASAAIDAVQNAALLLISAEACGGMQGTLDIVVDYLNTRTAFGRKIGAYQGLKHPTVDILVGLERSRSHVYHAASVLGTAEEAVAVRMAKCQSADAFAFAGDRAIQFHGGFGFTFDCDAQLFLRRALWCQYWFGDAAYHRRHLADAIL